MVLINLHKAAPSELLGARSVESSSVLPYHHEVELVRFDVESRLYGNAGPLQALSRNLQVVNVNKAVLLALPIVTTSVRDLPRPGFNFILGEPDALWLGSSSLEKHGMTVSYMTLLKLQLQYGYQRVC